MYKYIHMCACAYTQTYFDVCVACSTSSWVALISTMTHLRHGGDTRYAMPPSLICTIQQFTLQHTLQHSNSHCNTYYNIATHTFSHGGDTRYDSD